MLNRSPKSCRISGIKRKGRVNAIPFRMSVCGPGLVVVITNY